MDAATLWRRLHDERMVAADVMPVLELPPHTPWYTRAMLGFAGWLAGMFLVAFVGGSFAALFRDGPALMVLGLAFCAGAIAVDRRARTQEVLAQMALAISIAGQAFFAFGFAELVRGDTWRATATALVVLYAIHFVLGGSFVFRLVSATFGTVALLVAVHDTALAPWVGAAVALAFAALWADEAQWRAPRPAWIRDLLSDGAAPWALALVLAAWSVPAHLEDVLAPKTPRYLYAIANGIGLAWIAWRLTAADTRARALALVGVALLIAASHGAPGVIAGVLVLVAGFAAAQRGLVALGVLAVVGFLSAYYYQLHQTLLVKSMWLAVTAAGLLAALAVMRAVFRGRESP